MNSPVRVVDKFRIVLSVVTIAPLWLMLAATSNSANAQTASSPADWTQFHRDNMQRWNPYETVLGVGNAGSLQLKWKYDIAGEASSAAVVNGVVYFGSGDGTGFLYALDANTGAFLWSYNAGNLVDSPAVANGVVYFGSENNNVYALNASTGVKLWSFATGAGVGSSPAVANGMVYVGSDDHNVYALNASTGAKLWSFTTGDMVFSSPAVVDGVVYVGSDDHNVYALNANTGVKLWSFNTGGIVVSSPAVANGVVYVGNLENGTVYALNAATGTLLWSFKTGNEIFQSSPAVANGVVYIGSSDGNVYALNASTGAKLWSYTTGNQVLDSPAVANGVVYFTSVLAAGASVHIAEVGALNASTGAKLWTYTFNSAITSSYGFSSSPTIVDGVIYVFAGNRLETGHLYAFSVGSADLFLRIRPSATTVHQGDLLTYAFPVWNLGPDVAEGEVLSNLQVPAGTTFDYIRISGTPGLGTCTHPPYGGTGQIVCHEGDGMAPNTTWTVRLTVKVTAPAGTVITESAATMADTPDPNMANNMATVSVKVQ